MAAPTPPAVPGSNFPFDACCQKCSYKALIHSPEHAIETVTGQLEIIQDYKKDFPRLGVNWQSALEAGKVQHIFRFVCADCGKETQLKRPFERMEAGCTVAGWFTLVALIIVVGGAIYLYGAEAAMLLIPALPFFFAVFSEVVEWPFARKRKKMREGLRCSSCSSEKVVHLIDAQGIFGICPACGERAVKFSPRTE